MIGQLGSMVFIVRYNTFIGSNFMLFSYGFFFHFVISDEAETQQNFSSCDGKKPSTYVKII